MHQSSNVTFDCFVMLLFHLLMMLSDYKSAHNFCLITCLWINSCFVFMIHKLLVWPVLSFVVGLL